MNIKHDKMKKLILIGLMAFSLSLISCKNIKDRKSSNFPLRQLVKNIEKTKSFSGWYFIVAGGVSGSEKNTSLIKMYVLVDGEYNYLEIPVSDVKIKIDNSVEVPYVFFIAGTMGETEDKEFVRWAKIGGLDIKTTLVCSEKYLPEKLLQIGL